MADAEQMGIEEADNILKKNGIEFKWLSFINEKNILNIIKK